MVYAIAMNYVRNRFDADDIYSETFLRYFKKERPFREEEHRKAYLIRITINCSKDFFADKQRSQQYLDENETTEQADFEDRFYMRDILNGLTADERNLIYFFYYQEIKSAEIAELLAISDDAVRTRLKRVREKIKRALSH